jgi:hypothetical protein
MNDSMIENKLKLLITLFRTISSSLMDSQKMQLIFRFIFAICPSTPTRSYVEMLRALLYSTLMMF